MTSLCINVIIAWFLLMMSFQRRSLATGGDRLLDTPVVEDSYSMTSNSSTVFPCQRSIRVVVNGRPPIARVDHAGIRDVIRLYVRQYPAEGIWPTHIATTQLVYVAERVLTPNESLSHQNAASFDCQVFDDFDDVMVVGFCFEHARVDTVTGRVQEHARLCIPSRTLRVDGGWSSWTTWSTCSVTSSGSRGRKFRHRTCSEPSPTADGSFCAGNTLDWTPCKQQLDRQFGTPSGETVGHKPLLSQSSTKTKVKTTHRSRSAADERCAACGNCVLYVGVSQNESFALLSARPTECTASDVTSNSEWTHDKDTGQTAPDWSSSRSRTSMSWTIQSIDGDAVQLVVQGRMEQRLVSENASSINGSSLLLHSQARTVTELRVRNGRGHLSDLLLSVTSTELLSAAVSSTSQWISENLIGDKGVIIVELSETDNDNKLQQLNEDESESDSVDVLWTLTYISLRVPLPTTGNVERQNPDNQKYADYDIIIVLGVILFIASTTVSAAFVCYGRRHANVLSWYSTKTSLKLIASGSLLKKRLSTSVSRDYASPIAVIGSSFMASECRTAAWWPRSRSSTKRFQIEHSSNRRRRSMKLAGSIGSRANAAAAARHPYNRKHCLRVDRVDTSDRTSGHVQAHADSCINLAVGDVRTSIGGDTDLRRVSVYVSGNLIY